MMKTLMTLAILALTSRHVVARPAQPPTPPADSLFVKNGLESGSTSSCPRVILIFARGTFEPGNIGIVVGPLLGKRLEEKYGADNVWFQGVDYKANIAGIVQQVITQSTEGITEAMRLFAEAHSKCPDSAIVAGGYSQGAALMSTSIRKLDRAIQDQIRGVVLFGDPGYKVLHGAIPNFPADKVHVFCDKDDLVCSLTPFITPAHLSYFKPAGDEAPEFLESKIG